MRIARALGSLPDLRRHLAPSKITPQSGAIQRKVSTAIERARGTRTLLID
jgi:ribosomal protein S18